MVQMSSRWNVLIAQPASPQEKFAVSVQLAELPSAMTPAGVYRQSLYVNRMF